VCAVGANRGEEFFRAAGDVDTAGAMLTLDDDTLAVVSFPGTTTPALTSGTLEDALQAVYVAEACELSRQRRQPVNVAEVRQ